MNQFYVSSRKLLRFILAEETKAVIRKHSPTLIAICGDDQTSYIREALYQLILMNSPVRRTIERADSEFSIPLTVFGHMQYPKHSIGWVVIIIRTALQVLLLPPYHHTLIVHVDNTDAAIRNFWLQTLKPTCIIISNTQTHIFTTENCPILPLNSDDILSIRNTHKLSSQLRVVLKELHIHESDALEVLQHIEPPEPRVRLFAGKNGKVIIDARYHYYPPSLVALAEICSTIPGRKILIKDFTVSKSFSIPGTTIDSSIIPKNYDRFDVYIFLTRKEKYSREISQLVDNPLEV